MSKLVIRTIQDLTDQELDQLNTASKREFQVSLPPRSALEGRYFFLVKDDENILAMGQLLPIEPVIFKNEKFSVLGIGGIIANEKGKGYGKRIILATRNHLRSHNKTGLGFCKLFNRGFYEKCGLSTDITALQRLIYNAKGKTLDPHQADEENECIIYQDGTDKFMEKVLRSPDETVTLPIPPNW